MLRILAKALSLIFFKEIRISGNPHTEGKSFWCANHASGIVDPTLIFGVSPVNLSPISKSTLWKNPVMKVLLNSAKAIPVYRAQDLKEIQEQQGKSGSQVSKAGNKEAFKAVTKRITEGGNILIFPEGISHDEPNIQRLKSGVARMAQQAVEEMGEDKSVVLQPVSVDYFEKDEFRSIVTVHYGKGVIVNKDSVEIDNIMNALEQGMYEGLAKFETWDEKRDWHFLFELCVGRTPKSGVEFKKFVDVNRQVFENDTVFMARVRSLRRLLYATQIAPGQLLWGLENSEKRSFLISIVLHGLYYWVVSKPFDILTAVFWYLPYRLCGVLAEKGTQDRDVVATLKIGHGLWLFPLWYILTGFLTGHFISPLFSEEDYGFSLLLGFALPPVQTNPNFCSTA